MNETKVRILDAAERLIAEHGLDVSLRTITAEAGVNLAAVNYHFQSKDALIDAMIGRRIGPINQKRLELLELVEREAGSGPLPLEPVLHAFLGPVIAAKGYEQFRPVIGQIYALPKEFLLRVFKGHLAPVAERFATALRRALPELSEEETLWRMHFSIGAMVHVINWISIIPAVSDGKLDASDSKALIDRVVAFAAAGMRGAHV